MPAPALLVPDSAARFFALALQDLQQVIDHPAANDDRTPGVLEKKSLLTMMHLWDAETWKAHRSEQRWLRMIVNWPHSSIMRAIRLPFTVMILFTLAVIGLNRALSAAGCTPLSLPLAPLSLQAASIGLLLVFRNNNTHDRLKEAQRSLGGLGALGREIMQLLVVNVPAEASRDVCHAARLLALFGWAVKFGARGEGCHFSAVAHLLNPRSAAWILERPHWAASVLLRLRAVVGALRKQEKLSSDAFKFVEEKVAKLSAVDATVTRLSTFPVPPSYHRHSSRALMLWLSSLPFVLEGLHTHPVQALVAVASTTFLLLGIDQIAIEVEQPLDVLPLHIFARNMTSDIKSVLDGWAHMPSLPAADDDASDLGRERSPTVDAAAVCGEREGAWAPPAAEAGKKHL